MSAPQEPDDLLKRVLAEGRIHSAFLLTGAGERPLAAALEFVRGVVCRGEGARPCGSCRDCLASVEVQDEDKIALDGKGKSGPCFRHIGDHPDLYWIERGTAGSKKDTRIRVDQIRELQKALLRASTEGGWRAVIIAEGEWLNESSTSALLRLLEEPPPRTCIVLVTSNPEGLPATIRSRCMKVNLQETQRPQLQGDEADEETRSLAERFDGVAALSTPDLLDWAGEYQSQGERAMSAERVQQLLAVGSEWLRQQTTQAAARDENVRANLDAFRTLTHCRRDLIQRNANPQMIAERALLAVRSAAASAT